MRICISIARRIISLAYVLFNVNASLFKYSKYIEEDKSSQLGKNLDYQKSVFAGANLSALEFLLGGSYSECLPGKSIAFTD